jgi:SAM-dependent methyltransferase
MTINYADRFQPGEAVAAYETGEYAAGSYSSCIWHLQRPVLERMVKNFQAGRPAPVRLLDFACGTGRVLAVLASLVPAADGLDISENMVAVARTKCPRARLRVGDVLAQPELLSGGYDLITAFRFLLNAEPALRSRILRRLREALRPDGRLVVNVHGNSRSLRHPAIVWRRWRELNGPSNVMLNELSPVETRKLLAECGFEIVQQFGFGLLPPTLYRTPLCGAAYAVDRALAGDHWWNNFSIDMLFVCRPR